MLCTAAHRRPTGARLAYSQTMPTCRVTLGTQIEWAER
jgi:hypothetical protein